ncbi:hypothetical protein BC629DRAFT_1573050, partial [Irpex lacteus]
MGVELPALDRPRGTKAGLAAPVSLELASPAAVAVTGLLAPDSSGGPEMRAPDAPRSEVVPWTSTTPLSLEPVLTRASTVGSL